MSSAYMNRNVFGSGLQMPVFQWFVTFPSLSPQALCITVQKCPSLHSLALYLLWEPKIWLGGASSLVSNKVDVLCQTLSNLIRKLEIRGTATEARIPRFLRPNIAYITKKYCIHASIVTTIENTLAWKTTIYLKRKK